MSLKPLVREVVIARQPPEARAIIRALLAQNAALTAQVAALTEKYVLLNEQVASLKREVAVLKERLGKSPQNASLPPSKTHPHAKPPPARLKPQNKGS